VRLLFCGYTAHTGDVPNSPKTPIQRFRFDGQEWKDFGEHAEAQGTDRSELLRDFARWWMRRPGARLPPRPQVPARPAPSAAVPAVTMGGKHQGVRGGRDWASRGAGGT